MSWWLWPLLAWIPMTGVIAVYWWAPRWPAVRRQMTQRRRAVRPHARFR
jgi:hypothetical protein